MQYTKFLERFSFLRYKDFSKNFEINSPVMCVIKIVYYQHTQQIIVYYAERKTRTNFYEDH